MDWYDFLYVLGVTNEEDSLDDYEIRKLYEDYNKMFPDYPIDESFFEDHDINEAMEILDRAIREHDPIIRWTR